MGNPKTISGRNHQRNIRDRLKQLLDLVLLVADDGICLGSEFEEECRTAAPKDQSQWCYVCRCRDFVDHDLGLRQEQILAAKKG